MAEKVTLDQLDFRLTKYKTEDLQKKMDIALYVHKQCEKNDKSEHQPHEFPDTLRKCIELTGVPKSTLLTANSLEQKNKKFENWLSEQKQLIRSYDHEYSSIRKHLVETYTKELEIPTMLAGELAYEGFKKNFTLLQLPGTKSSIIVENPESVQERCKFLYSKIKYREAKKNIVYIGKVNILLRQGKIAYKEDNIASKNRFIVATSPKFGHLGYIYSCGQNQEYIMNWIEEKIIPELPKESVIIIQENVLNDTHETIDSLSTKEEMIDWLKYHKVNHDPKMHRADLYKITNKFKTSSAQLSSAEEALKAHGHIVLRKKKCNLNVNYFDPFWDYLIQELNASSILMNNNGLRNSTTIVTIKKILEKITLDYWQNLENVLSEREQVIYKEDLDMEDVIDKLVTMVKYEGLPKELKLNGYCKAMEQPPIYLHDTLRNLYIQTTAQNYAGLNISK